MTISQGIDALKHRFGRTITMITGIILEAAALLLGLFCLAYCLRWKRELYLPQPGSLSATFRNRHAVYLLMLGALAISAVAAVAEAALRKLGMEGGILRVPHALYAAFQLMFFFSLIAYTAAPPDRDRAGRTAKGDRLTALSLAAIGVAGVIIQAIWSIRVALFFEAVAAFGALALLESGGESAGRDAERRFQSGATAAIVLILLAVTVTNVTLILNLSRTQHDEIGNTQLDVIRSDLQDTITEAETNILHVAIGAEQLMEAQSSREALTQYFDALCDKYRSSDSFMNVYIAGRDWHIIPGFDPPEDFHAAERVWYVGAQDCPGEVFISEPYKDAHTGDMCFTVSTRLSDGETVVGMDLNFSKTQESILRMTQGREQTAMIVTSGGTIAGYTDMSLVGERADERLPEYADILRRVASSQEHRSFRVTLNDRPCMIFSSETSNSWYLILSADTDMLYGESYRQMAMMASVNLLMLAMVAVFCMLGARKGRRAEAVVDETRERMDGYLGRLRESAARLLRLGDIRLLKEGGDPAELVDQVRDSGHQLSMLVNEFSSCSDALRAQAEAGGASRAEDRPETLEAPSRKVRNGIIISLLVSLVIVLAFCIRISTNWGTTRMNREADSFEYQLSEWLAQQRSTLRMFTDMISTQPSLMEDYDSAVRWLNDIAGRYPEISACYMANPYAEHPVIMNTGWEPGEDERPETRPWYRETERSADGFSISAPYLDAQTGGYCITLSRVVYGKKDEFLGIFGIDFFLDKLIHVLGESYSSHSYAFLVDSDGVIINHPSDAYQMGENASVSIEDTEYAEAYNREGVTALRDYSGRFMACLSRRTDSGFTVMVANRWWQIYGSVVLVTVIFLALFTLCLAFIVSLINRLIRWQGEVNRRLVESAEAAQSANRAKSQFLSQMSHEIRTPMNAIIGLDSIALRDPSISPHSRDVLEKIGASARHLLSLINDILDMSRIESGRMALREEPFAFREFLEQITIIINGQCEDKGLRFVCNRIEPLDEYFVGDALKLKQVIINILGNSVKFTDPPGVITFTVAQTVLGDDRAALRFTMEDTGIGMDREFIPRIFEAFSQENTSTTYRYGGSGLGMAITRSIVEMMGGEIGVESEKGLGTTFTVSVTLGRMDAPKAQMPAAGEGPAASIALEGLHMLIVEDQEMNAEVLADLLDLDGMTSEWAENGQRAVEMFRQSEAGHFDAILMDMRMPVMDGPSATQEIRRLSRPDAATIPIIALTANAFEEDVRLCLQSGMNAHLSKPVDIDLLKETLTRLLAPDAASSE